MDSSTTTVWWWHGWNLILNLGRKLCTNFLKTEEGMLLTFSFGVSEPEIDILELQLGR